MLLYYPKERAGILKAGKIIPQKIATHFKSKGMKIKT
jgi:hypothetical protein